MKDKKALLAILAVALLATFGGTIAYFRFTETFANEFKLGASTTTFTETFESPSDWTPCTETPKTIVVTNTSTIDIRARIKITERWDKLDENGDVIADEHLPLEVDGERMSIINFAHPDDWVLNTTDGYYYYQGVVAAEGGATSSFLESVTFNCDASSDYSSAVYHLILDVQTVANNADALTAEGWNI